MTTEKQKCAVHFCERWLHISFEGDLEDKIEVDLFLSEYFNEAQLAYNEVQIEYSSQLESLVYI